MLTWQVGLGCVSGTSMSSFSNKHFSNLRNCYFVNIIFIKSGFHMLLKCYLVEHRKDRDSYLIMSRHSWKDVGTQPKVKYFTQVKARPPTFVAFVSGKTRLSDTDLRFLTRSLKEDFDMGGIPVRILQRNVPKKDTNSSNNSNNKSKSRKHSGKAEASDKRKMATVETT